MWDLVDHFYVTTYQGSPRIPKCKQELEHWNIPPEKITWNIPPKLEIANCAFASASKNHIDCYRDAKSKGYKNIVIFEDDIIVYDHSKIPEIDYKTNYFIKNFKNYDILYYGYFPLKIDSQFNEAGIIKVDALLLHAYLINEKFYSLFFDFNIPLMVDLGFPYMKTPIDFWIFNMVSNNKKYESYGFYPQLVYQDNMPAIFKKGNTQKQVLKFCCDTVTNINYNKDIIIKVVIIFIVLFFVQIKYH
jgi:hypothetical protein